MKFEYKSWQDQYRVQKGWGHEVWVKNFNKYCGKLLHINRRKKTSWHYHVIKEETLYLQSGVLLVYYSDYDDLQSAYQKIMEPGDSFHIIPGLRHRLECCTDGDLIFPHGCDVFEFSTEHFDSDSIRLIAGD